MTERQLRMTEIITVIIFAVGFLLIVICGCIPSFVKKNIECGMVAGRKLQKNADKPEMVKKIGKALEISGEKVLDKTGRCGEEINEDNVERKLGEAGEEADRWSPWWVGLPGTGSGIFDRLIQIVGGIAAAYFGIKVEGKIGAPVRRGFHAVTHWPGYKKEENSEEVTKS